MSEILPILISFAAILLTTRKANYEEIIKLKRSVADLQMQNTLQREANEFMEKRLKAYRERGTIACIIERTFNYLQSKLG